MLKLLDGAEDAEALAKVVTQMDELELLRLHRTCHDACCLLALIDARAHGLTTDLWLPGQVTVDAVVNGGKITAVRTICRREGGVPHVIAAVMQ